ncbi:hypothetical protein [Acidiphilium sp.]|uniref:hypothetical protein n=1 Tax=Acidiphilium sp. TaxID=527 RepID=UPI002BE18939|nr:hypothetical protein [Acidiphilium sp.]HQT61573.1 hypothetical protein [Acidiphilium sp.]
MILAALAGRTMATLLSVALLGAAALLLECVRARLAGAVAGEAGMPFAQPVRDLRRLLRKRRIRPAFASPLHGIWPLAALTVTITLLAIMPGFAAGQLTAGLAGPALFVGLLALGRAIRVMAGIDPGMAGPGLAAIRLAASGLGADLGWLLGFAALAAVPRPAVAEAGLAALGVLLAWPDAAPVPGDYAGPDRAVFQAEAMLRRAAGLALLVALIAPSGLARATAPLGWPVGIAVYAAKFAIAAAALGAVRLVLPGGAPRTGVILTLAALALALLGGVTAARLGIVAGVLGMGGGLALLWRRWPAAEALALLQGGAAMVGFGLGDVRGGATILAGVALGRIAVALAGEGGLRRWAIAALAGMPPFGVFAGDFRIASAAATVSPLLACTLVALLGIGAARGLTLPAAGGAGERPGRGPAVLLLLVLMVLLGAAPVAGLR